MIAELPVAILAGGLATRLRPLTERVPKSLIEVAGEPFVAHQLRLLASQGVRRAVLCTAHQGHLIEQFVGDGRRFGVDVRYSSDGPERLGTGGAIRRALPLLGEAFFVLYGDSYLPCDWQAIARAFFASQRPALMTVFPNGNRWDASNVEFRAGRIVRYDKTARDEKMRHIDYGLGVFHARVWDEVPPGRACDLAEVYRRLVEREELAACEVAKRFYEIGSFSGLKEFESLIRAGRWSRPAERRVG